MSVTLQVVDERVITVRDAKDLTASDVEQLGKALTDAGQNGYTISGIDTYSAGHQLDPYTTGFKLTLSKG